MYHRRLKLIYYLQSAHSAPAIQRPSPMCPDSLMRFWRYKNHLLTIPNYAASEATGCKKLAQL